MNNKESTHYVWIDIDGKIERYQFAMPSNLTTDEQAIYAMGILYQHDFCPGDEWGYQLLLDVDELSRKLDIKTLFNPLDRLVEITEEYGGYENEAEWEPSED